MYADHECLQQTSNIGEIKPRIQCWTEFLPDYNYRLSYRRGRGNANANFHCTLPLPPTVEDISGSSTLSDPDDLGTYVIRACDYVAPPCRIQGVGLGGLAPSSYSTPCAGLRCIFPLTGYSGLGWATPDERRLLDTPYPDASTANDRSP